MNNVEDRNEGKMERKYAEDLLKLYDAAFFTWVKDSGDHPSESRKKQLALARIREMVITRLMYAESKLDDALVSSAD